MSYSWVSIEIMIHTAFLQFWKSKEKSLLNFFLMCTIYGPKWKQAKFWKKKCLNAPNFSNEIFNFFFKVYGVFRCLFVTSIKHLGPKISITIKIYTLIREESLCSFCYEIPCNIQKKISNFGFSILKNWLIQYTVSFWCLIMNKKFLQIFDTSFETKMMVKRYIY